MESFIKNPNLPEGKVSLCLVDGRIPMDIENMLKEKGIRLIKTSRLTGVYEAISFHPDIMLHHLGGGEVVVAPNVSEKLIYSLEDEGFNVVPGSRSAEGKYPGDVAYNAARVGDFVLCNTDYTDCVLMESFIKNNLKIIHVKQGYAKCSVCVVSENAVITSDRGLHNILIMSGIDSLLISSGSIDLFEMNYGFIGGASGYISKNDISFYGNLQKHPDWRRIADYLQKYKKNPINLSENRLLDLGTLIPLKEYSILMP